MHQRMDRTQQGDVAIEDPSAYFQRFYYDTILHDPAILKWLADRVSPRQIVLGSDYSFPPAAQDPIATVPAAGLSVGGGRLIVETTGTWLFPRLDPARR